MSFNLMPVRRSGLHFLFFFSFKCSAGYYLFPLARLLKERRENGKSCNRWPKIETLAGAVALIWRWRPREYDFLLLMWAPATFSSFWWAHEKKIRNRKISSGSSIDEFLGPNIPFNNFFSWGPCGTSSMDPEIFTSVPGRVQRLNKILCLFFPLFSLS